MPPSLQVAQVVPDTEAEGPGRRFAVWLQGCPLRCPGCCNPEMLPERGGTTTRVSDLAAQALQTPGVSGISLLGGEPTAQAGPAAELARAVRAAGLSVMVFSGWTLDELRARADADIDALLAATDLLVDGRYDRDQPEPEPGRRWIGSRNQVMHFLTDRYDPADRTFTSANTVEIRLTGGVLTVNGWPDLARRALS